MKKTQELVQNKELMQAVKELILDGVTPDEIHYAALMMSQKIKEVK